jgi:probable HAF family extracellular repeat protein
MTDLGALDFNQPIGDFKINNHGDVIGLNMPNGDAALIRHGRKIDLGELGGLGSAARGVNDQDEVVGVSGISSSGSTEVFRAFLYKNGHMTNLGTLGGVASEASAMNDSGEIVGESLTSAGVPHGFLYEHGRIIDLNSLIPANSGFVITNAEDVNDRGQNVALAHSTDPQNTTQSVVLLNPVARLR